MPLKTDVVDICGYYKDSRPPSAHGNTYADALDEAIAMWETPFTRWPVRNRQPRTPIRSQKRAIIHERDGGSCKMCGIAGVMLTVDHIIPRSAFAADDLATADRSDNLVSACWPCNERKSNFESSGSKRLGVVMACWYCLHPEHGEPDEYGYSLEDPVTASVKVFCGRCGVTSAVPAVEGWVL